MVAALTALALLQPVQKPLPDSARAEVLWHRALDREAVLDESGAWTALRAARDADPTWLAVHLRYIASARPRLGAGALAAEYRARMDRGGVYPCLAAVLADDQWRTTPSIRRTLEEIERRGDPSGCAPYHLALAQREPQREGAGIAAKERWRRALERRPVSSLMWEQWTAAADAAGRHRLGDSIAAEGARRLDHPLERLRFLAVRIARARSRADTAAAASLLAEAEQSAQPAGPRGVLLALLRVRRAAAVLESSEFQRCALALLHGASAPLQRASLAEEIGIDRMTRGDPKGALPRFREAVAIADSADLRGVRAGLLIRLGRAHAARSQWGDAERMLRRALVAAEPRDRYTRADARHNLAHVLEGSGRLEEAAAEADRFVALARPLTGDGMNVIAPRDAGLIRWKLGQHASARLNFAEMLRRIDERQEYFFWAGEYFERTGELRRAADYYGRVPPRDTEEGARALAGLTRVYEALGMRDSAEAAARLHDRVAQTPEEVPQLPWILARRGRQVAAVSVARQWAERRAADGALHGECLARLQLAELLLEAGRPAEARAEAQAANRLAQRVGLPAESARAHLLTGRSWLSASPARAVAALAVARGLAERSGDPEIVLDVRQTLAEAQARRGDRGAALESFARAADAVEAVTRAFDADFDRVRYRDGRSAPFDGALRLLLDGVVPDPDAVLAWTTRRKSAVLRDSRGSLRSPSAGLLRRLQKRLDLATTLVDYTVLPDRVIALAVSRRGARVVRLPISPDSLGHLVAALRRPFTHRALGRVDLERARLPRGVSAALYAALLEPLEESGGLTPRLLVVPDGPLHLLPFDVLIAPSSPPTTPRYAVERYEIAYLPTASMPRRVETSRRDRLLIVGAPAPGGEPEVAAIAAAWAPRPTTVLGGVRATEARVRSLVPRASIVHVVAHAEVVPHDPQASHLALAPGPSSPDGLLHANEIARMHWGGALVVLSACETLVGPTYAGAGPVGLARAFFGGGAAAVVATQWPVDSSAARLMAAFYRILGDGHPPPAALRRAKLAALRDPSTSHPFQWGAYVWIGSR